MPGKNTDRRPDKYNLSIQDYKGVKVQLILYTERHFAALRAKRFILVGQNLSQNIWIPNSSLLPDGTLDPKRDLDWVFQQAWRQNKFRLAGIGIEPFSWTAVDPASNQPQYHKKTKA